MQLNDDEFTFDSIITPEVASLIDGYLPLTLFDLNPLNMDDNLTIYRQTIKSIIPVEMGLLQLKVRYLPNLHFHQLSHPNTTEMTKIQIIKYFRGVLRYGVRHENKIRYS